MNIPLEQKLQKYVLIDTTEKPSYARLSDSLLTESEAEIKNRAFRMNHVDKKYILEKDWK